MMAHETCPSPSLPLLAACAVQGTQLPPLGLAPAPVAGSRCGHLRRRALRLSRGAAGTRWWNARLPAGDARHPARPAVTMDFRAERLNVLIDGNAEVERVYCG
jgi:hypothetical protein